MSEIQVSSSRATYPNLLIAIGASAGGIEEVIKLVRKLPEYFQATILFACHRSPDGPNRLHKVLALNTDLEVRQPIEGEKLCCTTIYVGKPEESVEVDGRYLHAEEDISLLARSARIDDLFKSAAESAGENCVGVILSGTLSDGSEGLKAIKDHRGLAIVQCPEEAAFSDMPRNALEAVDANFVGSTDEIADCLIDLAEGRTCH